MKKRGPSKFEEQYGQSMRRVGVAPRARLEWLVRSVQASRAGMTEGERLDFSRDVSVFAGGRHAEPDDAGNLDSPTPDDADRILRGMDTLLSAALSRQPIRLGRRTTERHLEWDARRARYERIDRTPLGGRDFGAEALDYLGLLLERFGHLLRRCDARARWSEAKCGTLFVAGHPAQQFCSPKCRVRSGTQRFRKAQKKKKGTDNG